MNNLDPETARILASSCQIALEKSKLAMAALSDLGTQRGVLIKFVAGRMEVRLRKYDSVSLQELQESRQWGDPARDLCGVHGVVDWATAVQALQKRARISCREAKKVLRTLNRRGFVFALFSRFVSRLGGKMPRLLGFITPPSDGLMSPGFAWPFGAWRRAILETPPMKVHFATNRKPATTGNDWKEADNGLHYGTCETALRIPTRKPQLCWLDAFATPKLTYNPHLARPVRTANPVVEEAAAFYLGINERLAERAGQCSSVATEMLLFIHGYNVSFQDAIERTAQLAYALDIRGVQACFSWPSKKQWKLYLNDENAMEQARLLFPLFLRDVLKQTKPQRLYIISHSMGNRALLEALGDLVPNTRVGVHTVTHVIFTAPDVSRLAFETKYSQVQSGIARSQNCDPILTLYASSNDRALKASKRFHGESRAGDSTDILVLPYVDSVDVTQVNTGFLRHSYHFENATVFTDIFEAIKQDLPPSQRRYLTSKHHNGGLSWYFDPWRA